MSVKKWPEVKVDTRFRTNWTAVGGQSHPLVLPANPAEYGSLKDVNPLPAEDREFWATAVAEVTPNPVEQGTITSSTTISSEKPPQNKVEDPKIDIKQPPNSGFFGQSLRAMALYTEVKWGKPENGAHIVPIQPGDIWYKKGDTDCTSGACNRGGKIGCKQHPGEAWSVIVIITVDRKKNGDVNFKAMHHGQTSTGIRPGVLFCTVSGKVTVKEKKGSKTLEFTMEEDGTVMWDPSYRKTGYEAMYCKYEGVIDMASELGPIMKGRFYAPKSELKKFKIGIYEVDPMWLFVVGNLYNNNIF